MKDLVLVITFWERKLYLERILEYYNSFEKYYSDTELMEEANEILADIDKRLIKEEPTS